MNFIPTTDFYGLEYCQKNTGPPLETELSRLLLLSFGTVCILNYEVLPETEGLFNKKAETRIFVRLLITISNPTSRDLSYMRDSLLAGLLRLVY